MSVGQTFASLEVYVKSISESKKVNKQFRKIETVGSSDYIINFLNIEAGPGSESLGTRF